MDLSFKLSTIHERPLCYETTVNHPVAPPPLRLQTALKHAGRGVHRTVSAGETWGRLKPLLSKLGITRLPDITGLDRLGVPTYSCVRPLAHAFSVTITCGKGTRLLDAKVGAVMEMIEYAAAEPRSELCRIARRGELEGDALDLQELVLPPWAKNVDALLLEWMQGWDLCRDQAVWVPANLVFFPYEPTRASFIFTATTNGLAAGNRVEEAICHALAELIERDAWSITLARIAAGKVDGLYPAVDPATMPPSAQPILERFRSSQVDLNVRYIASDVEVPSFYATGLEVQGDNFLAHDGMGTHPDAEVALLRALTELAQSRAADIQGGREDLTVWHARATKSVDRNSWSYQRTSAVDFTRLPSHPSGDVLEDIEHMIDLLRQRGLDRVVVVDLTMPEIGVPVVRVVVPGLEIWGVDKFRAGKRVQAVLQELPSP
jgi:putative methanogenesis marker protein 1